MVESSLFNQSYSVGMGLFVLTESLFHALMANIAMIT
ncbi:hypothetical protein FHS59_001440 [Algoriphagus iocasae]|uniref:Uncharacterized protein n=1 Tax=Algoriphagus iocasae TaxID=1836499 RepID=A0A841MTH2_9BACT|nr:hypothetical protein [Algoriphagus iocasae]